MDYLKLKSGTDIRGIAAEGVEGEHINLTDEAICTITDAFLCWFCQKYDMHLLMLKFQSVTIREFRQTV